MRLYNLMIKTNNHLISGKKLTPGQEKSIAGQFLGGITNKSTLKRFYLSVDFPNNIDRRGRRLYPLFYIPPQGMKLKTLMNQKPGTQILSSNMYELEILRLLAILAPENKTVFYMLNETKSRLKTTCFGYEDDGIGEFYDTSLIALRFLAAAFPDEMDWIKSGIDVFHKHFNKKPRIWCVKLYYWLCLTELPEELAIPEIIYYKNELLKQLTRNYTNGSVNVHPLLNNIVQSCLTRLSEYESSEDNKKYINIDREPVFDKVI